MPEDQAAHVAQQLELLTNRMQQVIVLLNGDPNTDTKGMRNRLIELEKKLHPFSDEFIEDMTQGVRFVRDARATVRTLKWLLGFLGVTNAALLAAVIRLLIGGGG